MTNWFIVKQNKEHGPFSSQQIKHFAVKGKLKPDDMVKKGDNGAPQPAKNMKGLFSDSPPTSPPSLSPPPLPGSEANDFPDDDPVWHYSLNGNQQGPVTSYGLKELLTAGQFEADTMVWKEGMSDWQPASEVEELGFLFKTPPPVGGPPPLSTVPESGAKVHDIYLWIMVAIPILSSIVAAQTGKSNLVGVGGLNLLLCGLDYKLLKNAGYTPPSRWWIILIPGYIFNRNKVVQQGQLIFWVWMISLGLSLVVDASANSSLIEESAVPIVTQILHENLEDVAMDSADDVVLECVNVKIVEEVSTDFYKAKAMLNTGNEINITIRIKGEQLEVVIPSGELFKAHPLFQMLNGLNTQ